MNPITMRGLRASTLFLRPASRQSPRLPQFLSTIYARHASTTTPSTTAPTSVTYKPSPLNPPPTTMPPPLSIPEKKPEQSKLSYAYQSGKAYLTFYKTGLKNIYTNQKASRSLMSRTNKHKDGINGAIRDSAVTRGEFILVWRAWHDLIRVPAFALVIMICGEFTPLVVLSGFINGVVPLTCRIPKQVESSRRTLEVRRAKAFREIAAVPLGPEARGIEDLNREQLLQISASLGLTGALVERIGAPTAYLRWKTVRWINYLRSDDVLLKKEGSQWNDLDIEEVKMALVERGVDVVDRSDAALRDDLFAWLYAKEVAPVEKLLLLRPNVWPLPAKARTAFMRSQKAKAA